MGNAENLVLGEAANQISNLTFAFVRHGATDFNLRGLRCGGDVDVPLTETGCRMVFEMACAMQRNQMRFGVILCGGLVRARQSALLISGVLGDLPIISIPELDERYLGDWNGLLITGTEDLLARNEVPPGGESEETFTQRVGVALDAIRKHEAQMPLIVSSKGVGRVLNTLLGGAGRLTVANGELVVFNRKCRPDGSAVLELLRPLAVG